MNIVPLEDNPAELPNLNGERYFLVKSEVASAEIERFLESITDEEEVLFHDQFYPTDPDDDPGAYILIKRWEPDSSEYQYMLGNHHWSSKWFHQSLKFLSAYILINANSERFDGQPFTLKIRKIFRAKKTPPTPNKEKKVEKDGFLSRLFGFAKR